MKKKLQKTLTSTFWFSWCNNWQRMSIRADYKFVFVIMLIIVIIIISIIITIMTWTFIIYNIMKTIIYTIMICFTTANVARRMLCCCSCWIIQSFVVNFTWLPVNCWRYTNMKINIQKIEFFFSKEKNSKQNMTNSRISNPNKHRFHAVLCNKTEEKQKNATKK